MNILLIGNGFDLAHGLPTKYIDFLEFYKISSKIYTLKDKIEIEDFVKQYIWEWKMDEGVKRKIVDAFDDRIFEEKYNWKKRNIITTSNKLLDEFYGCLNNNIWIEYFMKCHSYVGENWIDFESEISNIIQVFDKVKTMINAGISVQEISNKEKERLMKFFELLENFGEDIEKNIKEMDKYIKTLSIELDKLIRALEIYIAGFVNGIYISKKSIDVENIELDYVLSFNYSNTYERVYHSKKDIRYNYIHGKATVAGNLENCNLVLGIDEYLDNDRKNSDLDFLVFKKFYQRIYKQTGNDYKEWVDEIKSEFEEFSHIKEKRLILTDYKHHNLYIFGHSLDVTDKDILKDLILNDNVNTIIFYLNKADLGRKISNLVKIIGQDELIRRTGGSTKTIEFRLQKEMVSIETFSVIKV